MFNFKEKKVRETGYLTLKVKFIGHLHLHLGICKIHIA